MQSDCCSDFKIECNMNTKMPRPTQKVYCGVLYHITSLPTPTLKHVTKATKAKYISF